MKLPIAYGYWASMPDINMMIIVWMIFATPMAPFMMVLMIMTMLMVMLMTMLMTMIMTTTLIMIMMNSILAFFVPKFKYNRSFT